MPYKDRAKLRLAQLAYVKRKRAKRWEIAYKKLGCVCAHCGTPEGPFDTDHIDPKTKEFSCFTHKGISAPIDKWLKELDKCQLLCVICHRKKTSAELRFPLVHGTHTGYRKRKCRCDLCKEAFAKHRKKWRR